MNQNLEFKPLTPDNFNDFSEIMNSMQVSRDCFCYSQRVFPEDIELGFPAQRKMESLVESGLIHGILAYNNNEPVLWVGLEAANNLFGHDLYGEILQHESAGTWVIHCLTSKPNIQGRQLICVEAIRKAIELAKAKGAGKLISFPVKNQVLAELPVSQRFSGTEILFSESGFEKQKEVNKFFDLWALEFTASRPKLSLA